MSVSVQILKSLSVSTEGKSLKSAVALADEGLETQVHRFQGPITAYVYHMTRDYEAARDLTQEVFIKVFKSLSLYRPELKFSTWIYTIARHVAVDYLRRRSTKELARVRERGTDGCELLASTVRTPEQEYVANERCAILASMVQRLPCSYRQLIIMHYSQDLSHDEIARITELPLGTVKNRLFRARGVLRQHLVRRGINSI